MPFNLLLLPLIGGYFWVKRSDRLQLIAVRADRTRYLMLIAEYGLYLLVVARIVTFSSEQFYTEWGNWMFAKWCELMPFPHSHTAFLALVLGAVAPVADRWMARRRLRKLRDATGGSAGAVSLEAEAHRADIGAHGSRLEQFFQAAVDRAETLDVMLTPGSRKVYMGIIEDPPRFTPDGDKYVGIVPTKSGYRDPENLELRITNDYRTAWQSVMDRPIDEATEEEIEEWSDQLRVYVPLREIVSASFFDDQVHSTIAGQSARTAHGNP